MFLSDICFMQLHFYGPNLEGLYSLLPRASLPADVGGEGPSYDFEGFMDFLSRLELKRTLVSWAEAS